MPRETMYYVRMMCKHTVFVEAVVNLTNKNDITTHTVEQSWLGVATVTITPVCRTEAGTLSLPSHTWDTPH